MLHQTVHNAHTPRKTSTVSHDIMPYFISTKHILVGGKGASHNHRTSTSMPKGSMTTPHRTEYEVLPNVKVLKSYQVIMPPELKELSIEDRTG